MHYKAIFCFISQMPYRTRNSAQEETLSQTEIKAKIKNKGAVLHFPTEHL